MRAAFRGPVSEIGAFLFRRLTGLETFIVRNNLIKEIERDALNGMGGLKLIDLTGNKVQTINDGTFKGSHCHI